MRFTIRTAMLTVAVAALCLTSYRVGMEHGRSVGPLVPDNISVSKIYTREYDISDLAMTDDDLPLLTDAIRDSVDPANWAIAGGYAELHHDFSSQKLVVSHTWPGHIELVRFLETVREHARYGGGWESTLESAIDNL